MSRRKELNFFFGPATRRGRRRAARLGQGHWHRGPEWYAAQFDASAPVRGEASPGYTSPSYPQVAARMAELIPAARLVYAVRDPIERAISSTSTTDARAPRPATRPRPCSIPGSQYIARGALRRAAGPFLATGAFRRIAVVAKEELATARRATLRGLFELLGVDADHWSPAMEERRNAAPGEHPPPRRAPPGPLQEAFADDAERLRALPGGTSRAGRSDPRDVVPAWLTAPIRRRTPWTPRPMLGAHMANTSRDPTPTSRATRRRERGSGCASPRRA